MNITLFLTFVIFLIVCIYLSVKSIKKYISYAKNYENILYWGLSFILLAFCFTANVAVLFVRNIELRLVLSNSSKITETLAWLLQLYAISYSMGWCQNYDTPECNQNCGLYCRRKIKRTVLILLSMFSVIGAVIFAVKGIYSDFLTVEMLTEGMQTTGLLHLDAYYATLHVFVILEIVRKLYKYSIVKVNLYYGYLVVGISKCLRLFIVISYQYLNPSLEQIRQGLITAGFLIIFFEAKKIIDGKQ